MENRFVCKNKIPVYFCKRITKQDDIFNYSDYTLHNKCYSE